jgi:hypothetical protein
MKKGIREITELNLSVKDIKDREVESLQTSFLRRHHCCGPEAGNHVKFIGLFQRAIFNYRLKR